MTSSLDVKANSDAFLKEATALVGEGAEMISTPEMSNFMAMGRRDGFACAVEEGKDLFLAQAREFAAARGIWLHLGSLGILLDNTQLANRSFLIDAEGDIAARYDKIHMFDVELGDGESYRESALYRPGDAAVVAETPWGKVGLTICYDLRFPYLYRQLGQGGAQIIFAPAAFTQPTGDAHWETLLRARAIENGCYVIAAAQAGAHACGRKTHGHSTIVHPWGDIVNQLGRQPGSFISTLDLDAVGAAREKIPSLRHDRTFKGI